MQTSQRAEASPAAAHPQSTFAERETRSWCTVPLPRWIYVGPQSAADFDRIKLPATVGEWTTDPVETVIRHDGNQYEHRCHSKVAEDTAAGVSVIFQWFEYRVATAALVAA